MNTPMIPYKKARNIVKNTKFTYSSITAIIIIITIIIITIIIIIIIISTTTTKHHILS